ncbi:MAG: hypothetical protein R3A52_02670 [Polyangiales bacterium]
MAIDWKRADDEGWDVEDIDRPRTVEDRCPACGRPTRMIERERVRNLTVLGVPIIATDKGGRVFQCARCGATFEVPDALPEGERDVGPEVLEAIADLEDQLRKAEDDAGLWRVRAQLADQQREPELTRDAREMVKRAERTAAACRAEIERMRGGRRRAFATEQTAQGPGAPAEGSPVEGAAQPAVKDDVDVVRRPADPIEAELAALRERVARKPARKPAPAEDKPAPAPAEAPAAAEEDDELTALKRKLGAQRAAPTEAHHVEGKDPPGADAPPPTRTPPRRSSAS